jgi:hypothetical protein
MTCDAMSTVRKDFLVLGIVFCVRYDTQFMAFVFDEASE